MRFLFILICLSCLACQNSPVNQKNGADSATLSAGFQLAPKEALVYNGLQIIPVTANNQHIEKHAELAHYKNLKEAMEIKGFRITESKRYGRDGNRGLVNSLTVQNKSQDTIYLMTGDVVQGGKQDRILAQDLVLPPRKLTDIEVFCVEQNRWQYLRDTLQNDHKAQQDQKVYAFTGYYNMASNDLRKTVKNNRGQDAVWQKVSELTAINNAESSTSAYAALEENSDFTQKRNEYLTFFQGKLKDHANVIGMVVADGSKILGTDIFNHPTLFKKQYEIILHGYIIDAISRKSNLEKGTLLEEEQLNKYFESMMVKYEDIDLAQPEDRAYVYNGKIVHYVN